MNKRTLSVIVGIGVAIAAVSVALAQQPVPVKVIQTGTDAGEALTWSATTFGGVIATALTALILKYLKNQGYIGVDLISGQLNKMVVDAINAGAADAAAELKGKGAIAIQSKAVANAVDYVQFHGVALLKALGMNPTDEKTVANIKARIMTAIIDPNMPTHPAANGEVATSPSGTPSPETSPGTTGGPWPVPSEAAAA